MKATEAQKLDIAKDIARKLEAIVDKPYEGMAKLGNIHAHNYIEVPRGTLKELVRMVRRLKG